MREPVFIEGVRYWAFVVRYTLADGRRRRMIRWAPAARYARDSAARELEARFGLDGIKPGSVTIRMR